VMTDLKITEVIRTYSHGNMALLEDRWRGTVIADSSTLNSIQSWLWVFNDDGLIIRQHDYFMVVGGDSLAWE
jgi:hypothetical protein